MLLVFLSFLFIAVGGYDLYTGGTAPGIFVGGAVEGWVSGVPYDAPINDALTFLIGLTLLSAGAFLVCCIVGATLLAVSMGFYAVAALLLMLTCLPPKNTQNEIRSTFLKGLTYPINSSS